MLRERCSGGAVVGRLACQARGPWVESGSRKRNFSEKAGIVKLLGSEQVQG